jgi:hypothetical protein
MLEAEGIASGEFLEYKERPLVRQDVDIYYGDLSDKYHIYMMIMTFKMASNGKEIPDMVMVQLMPNGSKTPEKQTMSKGLADALDTASVWLDRYNK